jgi:hypothetical protein
VRFFVHHHGSSPYSDSLPGSAVNGYDGWLVDNDFIVLYDQRIGCSQVNGKLLLEKIEEFH